MNKVASRSSAWICIVIGCIAAAQPAFAQNWQPRKGFEIVVGADPGGALDYTARVMQKIWQDKNIVDGIVLNKPGAGNAIAWTYLNTKPGDANHIAIASPNLFTNQLLGVSQLSYRDVTPLAILLTEYIVFIVKPDSPLKGMKDVVAPLRKDPAGLSIGLSPGSGSPAFTAAHIALKEAGVDVKNMRIVAYKAASAVVTALLSNDIDIAVVAAPNVPPLLAANRIRAIAVTSPARIPGSMAQVPTLREQGINAVYENWRGLIGPKDLTPEQIAFWENAILQATRTPEWKQALEKNGWGDRYLNNADSKKFLDEQFIRYKATYSDLGVAKN